MKQVEVWGRREHLQSQDSKIIFIHLQPNHKPEDKTDMSLPPTTQVMIKLSNKLTSRIVNTEKFLE